jgi:hypothetical protein
MKETAVRLAYLGAETGIKIRGGSTLKLEGAHASETAWCHKPAMSNFNYTFRDWRGKVIPRYNCDLSVYLPGARPERLQPRGVSATCSLYCISLKNTFWLLALKYHEVNYRENPRIEQQTNSWTRRFLCGPRRIKGM